MSNIVSEQGLVMKNKTDNDILDLYIHGCCIETIVEQVKSRYPCSTFSFHTLERVEFYVKSVLRSAGEQNV